MWLELHLRWHYLCLSKPSTDLKYRTRKTDPISYILSYCFQSGLDRETLNHPSVMLLWAQADGGLCKTLWASHWTTLWASLLTYLSSLSSRLRLVLLTCPTVSPWSGSVRNLFLLKSSSSPLSPNVYLQFTWYLIIGVLSCIAGSLVYKTTWDGCCCRSGQ